MADESYLDYENAGPKMVGTYKLKLGFEGISSIKSNYLPIELLHWAGMPAENSYMVEDILTKHPEYIHTKTIYGENIAFIATANNNVAVLKIIHKMFPEALKLITEKGNIIRIALEDQAYEALIYLMGLDEIDLETKSKNGLTLTHLACLHGNSDMLEILQDKDLADFFTKDLTYGRTPIYFVIEEYLAHQNNLLFEMTLEKYTKSQLEEKDNLKLTVLDYLNEKMDNQPIVVKRVYSPLLFSLNSVLGIEQ